MAGCEMQAGWGLPYPLTASWPQPLFTMSAQQPSIEPFTPETYEVLSRQFDSYPVRGPCGPQWGLAGRGPAPR